MGKMSKVMVLRGTREKTVGGLKAKDLTKNKYGRVVSKKLSAKGKTNPWIIACKKARRLEDQGLLCHQEGHPAVHQGEGVPEVSALQLSWSRPTTGLVEGTSSNCGDFYSC